ncbi:(S)-2-haloacid dehalogenase IVA [Pleurostoma richardsiae]|jgi:2-haloacid dehalogenase|uniref:(S)-2-haloacid dehalogenase IVA n=1 Tax=Pleurostoma richardsiae TaxID=41990 RepID=A0AA38RC13_9PEZI|nr:(S)-2-haloacid dehalogenase IVA [Pleurostoma richardsiae]
MDGSPRRTQGIKAVFFDFMGTCLDWHSSVVKAFPARLSEEEKSDLALEWRQAFFDAIRERPPGELPEDIDITHRRTLWQVLARPTNAAVAQRFQTGDGDQNKALELAVQAWHKMDAWPDVRPGLERLRSECDDCELFVLANGTTRLQLDLVRSSGLDFDMLFSSELLGVAKPTPTVYRKAIGLVKVDRPNHAVMVAAHAYDLRAAKEVGMKTIYIRRWTDDLDEVDLERIGHENEGNILGGFEELAETIKRL